MRVKNWKKIIDNRGKKDYHKMIIAWKFTGSKQNIDKYISINVGSPFNYYELIFFDGYNYERLATHIYFNKLYKEAIKFMKNYKE